jgi:Tol biopolymer transport system component
MSQRNNLRFAIYDLRFMPGILHFTLYVLLLALLFVGLTGSTQAQENTSQPADNLDTNLARAAAQSFLVTLTRPALADTMNFYLTDTVKKSDILSGLLDPAVTNFEISSSGWVNEKTYQLHAKLQPDNREITVYTGKYNGRWQVEGLDLLLATAAVSQATANPGAAKAPVMQPVSGNGSGTLVFQTQSGAGIYVINADGSGLRYLTNGIDPQLSPDGKQISFTRWEPEYALYTLNLDGSGEKVWTKGWRQMKSPTWAADGSKLVFSWQNGGRLNEERRRIELAEAAQNEDGIRVPRDAREVEVENGILKFKIPADAHWSLKEINLVSNQLHDPATDQYNYGPSGHPTDPSLFIFRGREGLGLYDARSNTARTLTADFRDRAAVISPDGSKIALTYWQNDHWEIHTMNSDGTNRQRLTETPLTVLAENTKPQVQTVDGKERIVPRANPHWNNAAPAWSPDGQQLAFMSDRTGTWEIWIMNADGSNQRPMFPNGVLQDLNFNYAGVDERMISWR